MIGSRNSSNSKRLVEVARDCGTEAYLIDNVGEVQEAWLEGARVVGISSGASAPENLVVELVEFFRERGVSDISEFEVVREDVRFMLPKQIREAVGAGGALLSRSRRPGSATTAFLWLSAAMRTLILSDLHLGSLSGSDLLRSQRICAARCWRSSRESIVSCCWATSSSCAMARYVKRWMQRGPSSRISAQALGEGELVLTAGNHDHALVEPWLAARGSEIEPPPLGVGAAARARRGLLAAGAHRRLGGPARVRVAYPGLWVRPDVYATHGHYLDCHLTVPTLERLSVAVMSRRARTHGRQLRLCRGLRVVGSPVFAWRDAVARDTHTGAALNGMATVSAWRALGGGAQDGGGPAGRCNRCCRDAARSRDAC